MLPNRKGLARATESAAENNRFIRSKGENVR